MGYKRALLVRWSRRDRLTVLVVAVTVAFLVGSGLLLIAAGTQTATIASEFTTSTTATYYDSAAAAHAETPPDALVFPVANVTIGTGGIGVENANATGTGTRALLIGVPETAPRSIEDASVPWEQAQLPPPPAEGIRGPVDRTTQGAIEGRSGRVNTEVSPHPTNGSLFPDSWYVTNTETTEKVGTTGALVLETTPSTGSEELVPRHGTAILAALLFFLAGMDQLLRILSLATIGGAILVLVVVFNVTRMTVRDRVRLIKVIRATGATPRTVLSLFGLRAGLIVTVGVALGYAIGVIVTNGIVNVAVFAGVPVSLSPQVTVRFARLLAPALAGFVLVGVLAGVLAARPATRRSPARLSATFDVRGARAEEPSRLRSVFTPTLLDTRAVIPTAMTLAVFAIVVVLVTSLVGAIAPLTDTEGGTITEAGAPHVVASQVDAGYASVLRSRGIEASPETLLMQASDGRPYLARGANYTAFAALSDARIVAGRAPNANDEAVIGRDLAATRGLGVGDSVTLGGSTNPAVDRVRIVGLFSAPGVFDDQLIVPLSVSYHLTNKPGVVQFIRTSKEAPTGDRNANGSVTVTSVETATPVIANESLPVRVQLKNFGGDRRTYPLTVAVGDEKRTRRVRLAPGASKQVTLKFRPAEPGNRTVRVDSYSKELAILPRDALSLPAVPETGPPGETLFVPVTTIDNRSVANATVTVGDRTTKTDDRGVARVTLPGESGTYEVTASKGNRETVTESIRVADGARKEFVADARVTPQVASVLARPTANVTLVNPWSTSLTRNVTVSAPTRTVSRTVTLAPGEISSTEEDVVGDVSADERASPGTYTVRVVTDGETLTRTAYTIEGDDRLFAALASSGQYSSGSGIGTAVQSVFGNLQILLVAMVVLAGLTTIGSTTATFAQTVHARRRAIGVHRATGATHRRLLARVLADALRLSIPATAAALVCAFAVSWVLAATGSLTVFGIRLSPSVSVPVVVLTVLGALALSCLSATLALLPFLRASPTDLLADADARSADPSEAEHPRPVSRGIEADD